VLNQAIKECFKEAIKQLRRVTLSKASICKAFLLEYQAIKDLSWVQSSDQDKFLSIKILDPSCKWFYGLYESDYPLSLLLLFVEASEFSRNITWKLIRRVTCWCRPIFHPVYCQITLLRLLSASVIFYNKAHILWDYFVWHITL